MNNAAAAAGVIADGVNFSEYVQKNIQLYELDNDVKLSTHAAANYIRREVNGLLLLLLR